MKSAQVRRTATPKQRRGGNDDAGGFTSTTRSVTMAGPLLVLPSCRVGLGGVAARVTNAGLARRLAPPLQAGVLQCPRSVAVSQYDMLKSKDRLLLSIIFFLFYPMITVNSANLLRKCQEICTPVPLRMLAACCACWRRGALWQHFLSFFRSCRHSSPLLLFIPFLFPFLRMLSLLLCVRDIACLGGAGVR